MTERWYLNEHDEAVAKRTYPNNQVSREPYDFVKHAFRGPVGQDGYSYMVSGSFSHEFVPHRSKRTGELTNGCEKCGWAESIHNPGIRWVHCDMCDKVVSTLHTTEALSHEKYPPYESMFQGKLRKFSGLEVSQRRYFCSVQCLNDWFDYPKAPDEDETIL